MPFIDEAKPPFANYDIVVYLGGGLFSIPFISRYLVEPAQLRWPRFSVDFGSDFANQAISTLALIFSFYIFGHIIAYASSLLIEKTIDRFLGKVSTSILLSSVSSPTNRGEVLKGLAYNRVSKIAKQREVISSCIRMAFHAPMVPVYAILFAFNAIGYYETRVTSDVINLARIRIKSIGLGELQISLKTKWFKPLEYYVINRYPSAIPRMYNYLIISGLFRSISFTFLCAIWMGVLYTLHYMRSGEYLLHTIMGMNVARSISAEFIIIITIYLFSLSSYIKFQRRYAEETIFAFVFCKNEAE